jgi:subtilisin family serine protease
MRAAIIDTGVRPTHSAFVDTAATKLRIIKERNFTQDNGGYADDAWDTHGHGTHVAGIVGAGGVTIDGYLLEGVAPKCELVSIKILDSTGAGNLDNLAGALTWLADRPELGVSAVNLSLGVFGNSSEEQSALNRQKTYRQIARAVRRLALRNIPLICASGNAFYIFQTEGLAFPAILENCISVAATFDSDRGAATHRSGWVAFTTDRDRVTPYAQRLADTLNRKGVTIFAPGSRLISCGTANNNALAELEGTSQAAPIVTGAVLLMQEYYQRTNQDLPAISDLVRWLRLGRTITDGDDEYDNVTNTNKQYITLDIHSSLDAIRSGL